MLAPTELGDAKCLGRLSRGAWCLKEIASAPSLREAKTFGTHTWGPRHRMVLAYESPETSPRPESGRRKTDGAL